MRRLLGCLLLYGRRTPPPSITMMNGRVQVWIRDDQDEAFRIFDKIRAALAPADEGVFGGKWFCRCGHAFRPYHLTPGTECARRGCECGRFAPADEAKW